MRQYLNDLRESNEAAEIIGLIMGIVSIIMVLRRFAKANSKVKEHRAAALLASSNGELA